MARAKKAADPWLVGYQFPYDDKKTPYDYIADPETGLRPLNDKPPVGFVKVDLTRGIGGITLPPLEVWREGKWENELTGELKEKFAGAQLSFESWIVSGEGTPSNYAYRVYVLPRVIAEMATPKHPMMWRRELKEGRGATADPKVTAASGYGTGYGTNYGYQGSAVSKPKQAVAALPVGIVFRCPGCGHFYKETGLAPHTTNCCPGLNGGESDWVIRCECCTVLSETAKSLPGYPRKPKVLEKEVDTETKEPVAS